MGALGRERAKHREERPGRPPILKNTGCVLIGYEKSLLSLILQPLTSRAL